MCSYLSCCRYTLFRLHSSILKCCRSYNITSVGHLVKKTRCNVVKCVLVRLRHRRSGVSVTSQDFAYTHKMTILFTCGRTPVLIYPGLRAAMVLLSSDWVFERQKWTLDFWFARHNHLSRLLWKKHKYFIFDRLCLQNGMFTISFPIFTQNTARGWDFAANSTLDRVHCL